MIFFGVKLLSRMDVFLEAAILVCRPGQRLLVTHASTLVKSLKRFEMSGEQQNLFRSIPRLHALKLVVFVDMARYWFIRLHFTETSYIVTFFISGLVALYLAFKERENSTCRQKDVFE